MKCIAYNCTGSLLTKIEVDALKSYSFKKFGNFRIQFFHPFGKYSVSKILFIEFAVFLKMFKLLC